jgi:transposase
MDASRIETTRGTIGDLITRGERIRETASFKDAHGRRKCQEIQPIRIFGTDRRQIGEIDQQLRELLAPMAPQLEQLVSIPGVSAITARDIIAEIGVDMARFDSAARLSAWAGLSLGNNESAGKQRKSRTCKGNRYLRRGLVQCAWATRKTSTFLGRTFRRLEARLGSKKAAMAVAHKILVIIYHLLLEGTFYEEER